MTDHTLAASMRAAAELQQAHTVLLALEGARPDRADTLQYAAWLRTARAVADALADAGCYERVQLHARLGLRYPQTTENHR